MAQAVIGDPFTFQVLFVDNDNNPLVPDNPVISVFSYSDTGVKQFLVNNQPLNPAVPAEVGRYTYTVIIPLTYTDGDMLYGLMSGTDPLSSKGLLVEQEVVAISPNRGSGGGGTCPGLIARFVKGG